MTLFLLCFKIFFARITDVTLGTIRTVYTVKGKTVLAGLIAFIEITIWFLISKEALNTMIQSYWIVISYASGYSVGTIFGTFISKFINSLITIEVIAKNMTEENINKIRKAGYGVSILETKEGYDKSKKSILLITLNSKYLKQLEKIILSIDKSAFLVIKESKIVNNGFIK